MKQFDASGLRHTCSEEVDGRTQRQEYVEAVLERARMEWPEERAVKRNGEQ